MAQIWIQGKPVTVSNPTELLSLLPLADTKTPGEEAVNPAEREHPSEARPNPLAGFFAQADESTQAVLRALARSYPGNQAADELRKQITGGRELRGIMSTIAKQLGKGKAVDTEIERKGKQRTFRYRLYFAVKFIACAVENNFFNFNLEASFSQQFSQFFRALYGIFKFSFFDSRR